MSVRRRQSMPDRLSFGRGNRLCFQIAPTRENAVRALCGTPFVLLFEPVPPIHRRDGTITRRTQGGRLSSQSNLPPERYADWAVEKRYLRGILLLVVGVVFVPIVTFFGAGRLFVTEEPVMSSPLENDTREFRSPQRKLVRFFERSRNNWKRKCMEAKQRCKLLANQVRAVEKSRAQWRAQAEAAGRRLEELEQTLAEQKREPLAS